MGEDEGENASCTPGVQWQQSAGSHRNTFPSSPTLFSPKNVPVYLLPDDSSAPHTNLSDKYMLRSEKEGLFYFLTFHLSKPSRVSFPSFSPGRKNYWCHQHTYTAVYVPHRVCRVISRPVSNWFGGSGKSWLLFADLSVCVCVYVCLFVYLCVKGRKVWDRTNGSVPRFVPVGRLPPTNRTGVFKGGSLKKETKMFFFPSLRGWARRTKPWDTPNQTAFRFLGTVGELASS